MDVHAGISWPVPTGGDIGHHAGAEAFPPVPLWLATPALATARRVSWWRFTQGMDGNGWEWGLDYH